MYSGPQLGPVEESTITTEVVAGDPAPALKISSVDGKKTVNFFERWFTGWATRVKVAPGKHDLHLIFHTGSWIKTGSLWVVTCPGKTYIARARYVDEDKETQMWIEDEETGKRVGGMKGSADEPKAKDAPCDQGKSEEAEGNQL
jgi:hypothetical protein